MAEDKQRTLRQNAALHKWMRDLADELNKAGFSVMEVMKHDAEIPFTEEIIKELMLKRIMWAAYKKKSTTELTTKELSNVAEIIMRHLGEKCGIICPFPSEEELINEQRVKNAEL